MLFRSRLPNVQWVTATLETFTSNHETFGSLDPCRPTPAVPAQTSDRGSGKLCMGYWLDLDRFIIQFWESRSIRSKIIYFCTLQGGKEEVIDCVVFVARGKEEGNCRPWFNTRNGDRCGCRKQVLYIAGFFIAAMTIPVFD